MESYTPPPCLRWAKSFHYLLKDPEGIKLFRNYLDQEDESLARPLYFWFACNGIKEAQDPATIQHLIKVIYKKYVRIRSVTSQLFYLFIECKRIVKDKIVLQEYHVHLQ